MAWRGPGDLRHNKQGSQNVKVNVGHALPVYDRVRVHALENSLSKTFTPDYDSRKFGSMRLGTFVYTNDTRS